jgi:hypothetical protein
MMLPDTVAYILWPPAFFDWGRLPFVLFSDCSRLTHLREE